MTMSVSRTMRRSIPSLITVVSTPLRTSIITAPASDLIAIMKRLNRVSNTSESTVHATWNTTSESVPTSTMPAPRSDWMASTSMDRSSTPTTGFPVTSERRRAVCVDNVTVEFPTKLLVEPEATPSCEL